MAAAERIQQQRASRMQPSPLHSSSVPSTPHQQARDLQFPSRSPSPGRDLPTRSPRSATAETHPKPFSQRTTPVVCKFETGAEFRKRRIPYKDGGNEPLPPPSKDPKKTLEPNEEEKLSGDMRELYDRLLPTQESEERRAKLIKKLEKILNDEWPGNDIKVNVFGSSGNLLASSDSDVDICITTSLKKLESMHGLATVLHQHGMERVICRAAAKVPIVKIWDPELQLACDMNVNNTLALENTRMIKTYVQIDERVRPLAKIVKYWTKQRILNDAAYGGTISSYTWICMIINFLQTRDPPILPSLQHADPSLRSKSNGQVSEFADDVDELKKIVRNNSESLGSLLFHFFRYYGYELDYQKSVMSVKEGRVLSRKEKGWHPTNYQDKEARVRLCVEEPFNTIRNLGNSADDYAFSGIHEEIRRAFDLVAAGKLDECCAEYIFPPEEKPLFQKPAPKPKPILTRSASQSGGSRSHANSVGSKSGGSTRNNRTSSSHRGNNRRASSGATFGNPRFPFMSPSLGLSGADYFAASKQVPNDQLHEQLYQQYQFLQAQQELLRSQLMQQQHQHAHIQAVQAQQSQTQSHAQAHGLRTTEFSTASPRQRAFAHSVSTPRSLDSGPSTAPLLPGYLYHYPARHPAPISPLSQTRMQEGSMTNPSSPSSTATMPPLRRGMQRGSIPEGMAPAATRSQSQPGRAFPSPVALQSMVHPGYDVSGAISTSYLSRQNPPPTLYSQTGYDVAGRPLAGGYLSHDNPMPKEYVGYYMGQSPQLIPQGLTQLQHVPALRSITPGQRKSPPEDLPPILPNGSIRRQSPPAHPHRRSSSLSTQSRSDPIPQVPFPDIVKQRQLTDTAPRPDEVPRNSNGPVIANGSKPAATLYAPIIVNSTPQMTADTRAREIGASGRSSHLNGDMKAVEAKRSSMTASAQPSVGPRDVTTCGETPSVTGEITTQSNGPSLEASGSSQEKSQGSGGGVSPSLRAKPPPPLNLSPKITSTEKRQDTQTDTRTNTVSPPAPPPLLSPVAELQTPSPTSSRGHGSPKNDAKVVVKNAQIANGRLNERVNAPSSTGSSTLPLAPSKAVASSNGQVSGATNSSSSARPTPQILRQNVLPAPFVLSAQQQSDQWQQATTRKHKKVKSLSAAMGGSPPSRDLRLRAPEVMPARESERKGG